MSTLPPPYFHHPDPKHGKTRQNERQKGSRYCRRRYKTNRQVLAIIPLGREQKGFTNQPFHPSTPHTTHHAMNRPPSKEHGRDQDPTTVDGWASSPRSRRRRRRRSSSVVVVDDVVVVAAPPDVVATATTTTTATTTAATTAVTTTKRRVKKNETNDQSDSCQTVALVSLENDPADWHTTRTSHCCRRVGAVLSHWILHGYHQARQAPPRYQLLVVILWVANKFLMVFLLTYLFQSTTTSTTNSSTITTAIPNSTTTTTTTTTKTTRILYIVTSLDEFQSGHRATVAGSDRFAELVLPVLLDSVQSTLQQWRAVQVDVYLILAYRLTPERHAWIQSRWPPQVGLQIWDDAAPLAYDSSRTRRQRRRQRQRQRQRGQQQRQPRAVVETIRASNLSLTARMRRLEGANEVDEGSATDDHDVPEQQQDVPQEEASAHVNTSTVVRHPPTSAKWNMADPSLVLTDLTRALSRQHRYVIKDKLPYYDVFLAWEDDMRVTGPQIQHFWQLSQQIEELRSAASSLRTKLPPEPMNDPQRQERFFGPLSRRQLDRLMPGFVRVEVLWNASWGQEELDPIARDYLFPTTVTTASSSYDGKQTKVWNVERHFEPQYCCHVQMEPNKYTPPHPKPEDVIVWETSIKALSLRQLPKMNTSASSVSSAPWLGSPSTSSHPLDWVVLLPGPGKRLPASSLIGGYWSGRNGAFGTEEKPSPGKPDLVAQQGGWMATREQILRFNNMYKEGTQGHHCMGAFLPPFDEPVYRNDGLDSNNVEFWSGGYQLFTGVLGGCNMQRIVSMDPDHFSKHFLYHVSNNKQKQRSQKRMVRVDHLLGQLNTVLKQAKQAKESSLLRADEISIE